MSATAELCSQCGWAFDTEAMRANTCRKCKSAILITSIAYLEKFEHPAIRKYIEQYEGVLEDAPRDRDALLALGICHLKLGLYEEATEYLGQMAKSEPSGSYYKAICLFKGKRPRWALDQLVREAQRLLEKAIALDPVNGRYEVVLAGIRHDYYELNGLSVPGASPDELILAASKKHFDPSEIEQAFRLLKMNENEIGIRVCS